MPNYVYSNVVFEEMNDAARDKWNSMIKRVRKGDDIAHGHMWMGDLWVDGKEGSPTYEQTEQYEWTLDNVGPKWTYFEDIDENGFQTQSAWSWPEDGLNWVLNELSECDPNMITTVVFEDEMPNFYGVYVYEGTELVDGFEDDHDELMERIVAQYPELKGKWDEDEGEWADEESEDLYREVMWEVMGDSQWDLIQSTIEMINDAKKIEKSL
jgi:hypothetical protein